MINLAFLLLIFFMLAGSLHTAVPFEVDAPTSRSGTPGDPQDAVVLIDREGRLAFGDEELDAEGLHDAVLVRVAEEPGLVVHLKADGRTPATRVIEMMELMRDAGVKRLVLLTLRPES